MDDGAVDDWAVDDGAFAIRPAEHADADGLRRLIELSVRGLQRADYTQAQIDGALGHVLGLDTQLIEDGTYFAAAPLSAPGRIVGCGGWSFRATLFGGDRGPGRDAATLDPAREPARIRAIFVHPDWARRGVASLILVRCEDEARRAGFRALEMGSTLTGAPVYARRGYARRDEVAVPLPNGETLAIVRMSKTLEG